MTEKKMYILFKVSGEHFVCEPEDWDAATVEGFVNFMEASTGVLHLTLVDRQKIFSKTQVTCIELIEAPLPGNMRHTYVESWSIRYPRS